MIVQDDALRLLAARRTGDDEAVVEMVIANCDKDAVIRALLDHFYGIDDAYFGATQAEGILDSYFEFADLVSRATSPS